MAENPTLGAPIAIIKRPKNVKFAYRVYCTTSSHSWKRDCRIFLGVATTTHLDKTWTVFLNELFQSRISHMNTMFDPEQVIFNGECKRRELKKPCLAPGFNPSTRTFGFLINWLRQSSSLHLFCYSLVVTVCSSS